MDLRNLQSLKIIKNDLDVFKRAKSSTNGILYFVFRVSQSSRNCIEKLEVHYFFSNQISRWKVYADKNLKGV